MFTLYCSKCAIALCLKEQHIYLNFFFWLHCAGCGILVPQPGIEPPPPALEAQSLNHWAAKEVPHLNFFFFFKVFYLILFIYLFIYLFLAVLGLRFVRGSSPVAASGGHSSSRCGDRSSSRCAGLSLSRPLPSRGTGSRRAGSAVVAHGPSCSVACGIFPDQGSNPCPLH